MAKKVIHFPELLNKSDWSRVRLPREIKLAISQSTE